MNSSLTSARRYTQQGKKTGGEVIAYKNSVNDVILKSLPFVFTVKFEHAYGSWDDCLLGKLLNCPLAQLCYDIQEPQEFLVKIARKY